MRNKWFRRIRRFIELFTPGGTEYTPSGIAIVYSRTGATTIPTSEYEKILFQRLDEFKRVGSGTGVEQHELN
jgi:hypothetical protein